MPPGGPRKLPRETYERELLCLQTERAKLLERVRADGARLVIILEGRETAGKGGSAKRATGISIRGLCRSRS